MPLNMNPEEKDLGRDNFNRVIPEVTRRGFLKTAAGGAIALPIAAAAYFGYNYEQMQNKPVRAGIIGTGDEGGVLVGEHNPKYLEFVAYSDIRPYNQKRIFEGEKTGPRKGFNFHYGTSAKDKIKLYTDYKDLLKDDSIEAVVIALPLHLHAKVAIDAMEAGKHVLCEKLMAWNIPQCKKMIQTADKTGRILTIGHQRHYSTLYAQAVATMNAGVLGEVRHIRALWHRNNTWPRVDGNGRPIPGQLRDSWRPEIRDEDAKALKDEVTGKYDYKSMEELVRWRLYNRTGGGLMAELGSHQLDACSIFLGKVHPLSVTGVGGKIFYDDDREVDDHVFVTFEFPGRDYAKDKDDKVVVTYSSISTNSFEAYGECVMGTKGTMVVENEQQVLLYAERDPNSKDMGAPRGTSVTVADAGGKPALDASASTGPAFGKAASAGATPVSADAGPPSRGYREEMEHFAFCVRQWQEAKSDEEKKKWQLAPRCHGRIAMADAIIALTSNLAMKTQKRIEFKESWFDAASPDVPDADVKALNAKGEPIDY